MVAFKKQKGSLGTAVKWDGIYRSTDEEDGEETRSRAFRSSRTKRYEFKTQDKKDFQDDEDLVEELAHMKLVSNYRDLTGGLDIQLKGFEDIPEAPIPGNTGTTVDKKSKRKKVKLAYDYEDEDEQDTPEFDIKLKSVDSKMKFQKNIPKMMNKQTTASKQITDPIYKSFIKKLHPEVPKTEYKLPEDYQPKISRNKTTTATKNCTQD
ncbi:hypothetical protein BN7_4575 [Wickerhamomyces ciferrii]|uniref:Uncharacterized protein n=1 Tax=Wickerhamomyces ciferrii (strain ATCC 14091 / BCRC 22168 / CBS 111 / JCM 3599 / NBRC 0793 / NRRL Y-1031 F-60-10) TaxID=1206466 RepID=K0KPR1_WICCF|nr:uncharacterized protein BN7_4575 [Wickerhamomyces ciferrii]CCH44996.1 hypothetical protein BN7_4575 [Wickerhamomyces ciferrii]